MSFTHSKPDGNLLHISKINLAAMTLSRLFLKRAPGTSPELTELEISGLREIGNIVVGAYCTVLANTLSAEIIYRLPLFHRGMLP